MDIWGALPCPFPDKAGLGESPSRRCLPRILSKLPFGGKELLAQGVARHPVGRVSRAESTP